MNTETTISRLNRCVRTALPKGLKTAWWLIKITVPVSFGVMLLDYFGILNLIAQHTGPFFKLLGLPGVSAIVLITSIFTNIYSVVAILAMLNLPVREGIILATMCLVSHGFLIETAVMKRTGSSPVRMLLLRIAGSFAVAWMLNMAMPGHISNHEFLVPAHLESFSAAFLHWFYSISSTVIKILILVNVLLIFQQIMEEFGWIGLIDKPLSPLMKIFGLPQSATLSWVVANLIGLAYGSAIMIDQTEKGKMSREDADLLNHHVSVSHSQLEDPLLFLTLGYTLHWLIWPRVLVAIAAVWLRKAGLKLKNNRKVLPG
ncbi:MAG: nucleoside recognition protein [Lentimicrobium sp.]|nr:nucleoside recognition protein [Lentimicrobium sp.]HPG32626.1 nucleoside recognition protein [Lentimicrobium sp.]